MPIPAEGLKEIKKIARMEWPSKKKYPDDPIIRSKNTVHDKNIRRANNNYFVLNASYSSGDPNRYFINSMSRDRLGRNLPQNAVMANVFSKKAPFCKINFTKRRYVPALEVQIAR
ncbi:MAG: hypothetical protein GXY61_02875 [Lentisphaerae bacterium]|nr:hypothetical protein [Lentisphaerota bacterium]